MCEAVQNNKSSKRFTGVGFVFTEADNFAGIDIDGCLNNGQLNPVARQIVENCDSYTEISPSGAGLHIIIKGVLPNGIANKISMDHVGFKALELYDHARYFTMSGKIFENHTAIRKVDLSVLNIPTTDGHRSRPINRIPTKDEEYLLNRIKNEKDGLLFSSLHDHGDLTRYGNDQSKADLAYIGILAKWTNFDAELTDSIYRKSALMRPK